MKISIKTKQKNKKLFSCGPNLHAPLKKRFEVQCTFVFGKYDKTTLAVLYSPAEMVYFRCMETDTDTLTGLQAMQWAKEISKLPDGCFTIAFFRYSRNKNVVSDRLEIKEGCKFRTQMPDDKFSIDGDNLFLFTDKNGEPKMCYRILVRYMGFPNDNYKLHKIDWLQ